MSKLIDVEGQLHLSFFCPACETYHAVNTKHNNGPKWTWNGSYDKPTFNPSVRVRYYHNKMKKKMTCHFFVRDGFIEYCGDCTHEYANKKLEIPNE